MIGRPCRKLQKQIIPTGYLVYNVEWSGLWVNTIQSSVELSVPYIVGQHNSIEWRAVSMISLELHNTYLLRYLIPFCGILRNKETKHPKAFAEINITWGKTNPFQISWTRNSTFISRTSISWWSITDRGCYNLVYVFITFRWRPVFWDKHIFWCCTWCHLAGKNCVSFVFIPLMQTIY